MTLCPQVAANANNDMQEPQTENYFMFRNATRITSDLAASGHFIVRLDETKRYWTNKLANKSGCLEKEIRNKTSCAEQTKTRLMPFSSTLRTLL